MNRVEAALRDAEFMRGVLEARDLEAHGAQGEPWEVVRARLRLNPPAAHGR